MGQFLERLDEILGTEIKLGSRRKKDITRVRKILTRHYLDSQKKIAKKHRHAVKFVKRHSGAVWEHGRKVATAGAIAGALIMAPVADKTVPTKAAPKNEPKQAENLPPPKIVDVPKEVGDIIGSKEKLTPAEEEQIGSILSDAFRIKVSPTLNGHRLNVVYGKMGGEQHLRRYPGDVADNHKGPGALPHLEGMAPGNGAYGLWAENKADLTDKMVEEERFYIAAQTFLAPGFRDNPNELYNFFKYRKMLIVNSKNGDAVVAVIGDAGPASWTGKKFGGSPEVMAAVGLSTGPRKGPVLVYFVDDPEDKVPLGPIGANGQPAPPLD